MKDTIDAENKQRFRFEIFLPFKIKVFELFL